MSDTITYDDILRIAREFPPRRPDPFGIDLARGPDLAGYTVVQTQARTKTVMKRCRSGSHWFIHWLARWLPIDPYVEWDWPEQVPDDRIYIVGNYLFTTPIQHRALVQMITA